MTQYNRSAGMTGFDEQEDVTDLKNTAFFKICLLMKNAEQINFVLIHKSAYSPLVDRQ